MPEELTVEKLIEAGNHRCTHLDWDNAIRHYKKALALSPEDPGILLLLGDAYTGKAQKDATFYSFAVDYYHTIVTKNPLNSIAYKKLIYASMKNHSLGDLASELKNKLEKDPENKLYKSYLDQITTLAVFDRDFIPIRQYRYQPTLLSRLLFDFVLLPVSLLLIMLSIFNPQFKGLLRESIFLLFFYVAYRVFLHNQNN
ncbi:MAG: hypothetical protein A2252_04305 [Elusimicrobia bacterium RIFOXYA2_FULL_39_19]|nr:MAG: hypothetical protein A2252_04305 [Elusimicrobia bacterium RIFOXYA2_FULL_39_19]